MKYIPTTSIIRSLAVTLNFRADEADAPAAKMKLVAEQKGAEARAAAIAEVAQLADLRKTLDEMQRDMQQYRDDIAGLQKIVENGAEEPADVTDAAYSLTMNKEGLAALQRQYTSLVQSACVVFDRAARKLNEMHREEKQRLMESHRTVRDKRQTELIAQIEALVTELAASAGNYNQALAYDPFVISSLIGTRPVVPNFELEATTA